MEYIFSYLVNGLIGQFLMWMFTLGVSASVAYGVAHFYVYEMMRPSLLTPIRPSVKPVVFACTVGLLVAFLQARGAVRDYEKASKLHSLLEESQAVFVLEPPQFKEDGKGSWLVRAYDPVLKEAQLASVSSGYQDEVLRVAGLGTVLKLTDSSGKTTATRCSFYWDNQREQWWLDEEY